MKNQDPQNSSVGLGVAGLRNLGNTCYMNAVLQCISHCPPIVHFFLSGQADGEISKFQITRKEQVYTVFKNFLKELWESKTQVAPIDFKKIQGKIDERWVGFDQQDAEEYYTFLINCLHEDLSRVIEKYRRLDVDEKLEPNLKADFSWDQTKKESDSYISDLFRGQFQDHLICPTCKHESYKFDPTLSIQLPLSTNTNKSISITFIPSIGYSPIKFFVTMKRDSTIFQLKQMIVSQIEQLQKKEELDTGVPLPKIWNPQQMIITELVEESSNFSKIFLDNNATINNIQPFDDIFAYYIERTQIPEIDHFNLSSIEYSTVEVYQRGQYEAFDPLNKEKYSTKFELVCYPFFIYVPTIISYPDLHKFLEARIKDLVQSTNPNNKEILKQFDIYVVERSSIKNQAQIPRGRRLFEFDSSVTCQINLSNSLVFIEWSALGIKDNSFQRIMNKISTETFGGSGKIPNLTDCLADYVAQEILSQNDTWYCPTCKVHQMAGKTMEIYRLPDIFVVQLKRFTKHKIGIKLDIMVDYPVEGLDMSPFVKIDPEDKIYDLFGVVCHVGMIACAGHYTAFCLNPVDMKWYYYDDSNVREVKKEQVVTRNAYILFYKKRSLKNELAAFDFGSVKK